MTEAAQLLLIGWLIVRGVCVAVHALTGEPCRAIGLACTTVILAALMTLGGTWG